MKHSLLICVVVLAALCFVACAAPAATATPAPTPEATPTPPQNVIFTDPVLENSVRAAINKPEGEISIAEAEAVTELTYFVDAKKYHVKADDNDMGGAEFFYYANSSNYEDGWCSREGVTVKEYFTAVFNNPEIADVYGYAISLMNDHIGDTFGMTLEELRALPTGE